jgi:hypothetical protein
MMLSGNIPEQWRTSRLERDICQQTKTGQSCCRTARPGFGLARREVKSPLLSGTPFSISIRYIEAWLFI